MVVHRIMMIGEVQVSVWNDHIIEECKKGNIKLL